MKRFFCANVLLVLIAMALFSCNPSPTLPNSLMSETPHPESKSTLIATPILEQQSATPAFTPIAEFDLFLPDCNKDPKSQLPLDGSGSYQGWYRYTNERYGFSFAFPPDWELVEGQNYLCIKSQSTPSIFLIVGFKRNSETKNIQRSGVGAGDIITVGTVLFLDQEISKDILRYENKDVSVLYNNATEILVGDLVFTISLDDFRTDYDTAFLSEEIEALADEIVESFALVK